METNTALTQINQQIKEMVGLYRDAVAHTGISENEFWIWYGLIVMGGAYTQQDICGMWSLSKQTVNTIITHLVKQGYVTLEVLPHTRNKKRITLTETGRAYGEALVAPIVQAEKRAIDATDEADLLVCTAALGRFIHRLGEAFHETI